MSDVKGIDIYKIINQDLQPSEYNQKIKIIMDHIRHLRSRYKDQNLFDVYQQIKLSTRLNQIIRNHIENEIDDLFFHLLYLNLLEGKLFDLDDLWEKLNFSPLQDYVDHCGEWSSNDKDILAKHINFMYNLSSFGTTIKDLSKVKIYCVGLLDYLSKKE
jgi:hypothetical protein